MFSRFVLPSSIPQHSQFGFKFRCEPTRNYKNKYPMFILRKDYDNIMTNRGGNFFISSHMGVLNFLRFRVIMP